MSERSRVSVRSGRGGRGIRVTYGDFRNSANRGERSYGIRDQYLGGIMEKYESRMLQVLHKPAEKGLFMDIYQDWVTKDRNKKN